MVFASSPSSDKPGAFMWSWPPLRKILWQEASPIHAPYTSTHTPPLEQDSAQRLADLLHQVPHLNTLLSAKELCCLSATNRSLQLACQQPALWHPHLTLQRHQQPLNQAIPLPQSLRWQPPPPLKPQQHFWQQSAIWMALHTPLRRRHPLGQGLSIGLKYQSWVEHLQHHFPAVHLAWLQQAQDHSLAPQQGWSIWSQVCWNLVDVVWYGAQALVLIQLFSYLYFEPTQYPHTKRWHMPPYSLANWYEFGLLCCFSLCYSLCRLLLFSYTIIYLCHLHRYFSNHFEQLDDEI